MKKLFKGPFAYVLIAVILLLIGYQLLMPPAFKSVTTQEGFELLKTSQVESVKIVDRENRVDMVLVSEHKEFGKQVQFYYIAPRGADLVEAVTAANLPKGFNDEVPQGSIWSTLLSLMFPLLIIGLLFWFLMASARGSENRMMQFGKSKAKMVSKDTPTVTFADVAGADEAVEEISEIRDFLKEPAKFQAIGAKIPKGLLLYGPPGTGKTLLARAVAGEAKVPFYSISGSDFVEMFVGVGASRVRDLFTQAKENAPAIIFIDEIDAVGRHRGAGMGGGHDEREQTLNQLLVEMDGFDVNSSVILIAATNRPDILDPALLRPGRFDRQIQVDAPDLKGRRQILEVHAKDKPLAKTVDLDLVARRTPGFTGADLANVLNEAALLTARAGAQIIDNRALDEAIDRIIAGPQRKTRIMRDHERLVTAYHEGGHALVAAAMNHSDPVTKITILPRGRALGYTMVMPLEDRYSVTRQELLDQLAYAMGGRVAEELIFHDPSTGASNDIEKATATARKMITEYGMSDRVGSVKLGQSSGEVFLGKDMGHQRDYSEEVAKLVDSEVRQLLHQANAEAYEALNTNREILDKLASELLEKETLNQEQIAEIFKDIKKIPARKQWLMSEDRPVSKQPPVAVPKAVEEAVAATSAEETPAPKKPRAPRKPKPSTA